jgi:hypothetical protein
MKTKTLIAEGTEIQVNTEVRDEEGNLIGRITGWRLREDTGEIEVTTVYQSKAVAEMMLRGRISGPTDS